MDAFTKARLAFNEAAQRRNSADALVIEAAEQIRAAQETERTNRAFGVAPNVALRASVERNWSHAPAVRDRTQAIAKRWNIQARSANSILLPDGLQSRTVTVASGGTAVVGVASQLAVAPAHDTAGAVFDLMTVTTAEGNAGEQFVGKFETLPTVTVLASETSPITEQTPPTGQAALLPKHLSSYGRHTPQWALQSAGGAAALIQLHTNAVRSKALQQIAEGTGANGQLLGLTANSDVPTAVGTSVDRAKVCTAMESVEKTGAGPFAWVVSAGAAKILRQRAEISGGTAILANGAIGGYPCYVTGCTTNAIAIFGCWSDLQVFQWRPLEIETDPFSDFAGALIGVRAWLAVDALPMLAKSFYTLTAIT